MKFIATIVSASVLSSAAFVSAETFKVHPRAGLWQSDTTLLIDGVDVLAEVAAMQQQMMANLPESAREAAGMNDMGASEDLTCITKEEAEAVHNVDDWLDQLSQDGCQFNKTGETANTVTLKASCDGSGGFTGEYTGKLVSKDDKSWTMKMEGSGSMGPGGPSVSQEFSVSSTWLSADCGNVSPEEDAPY